MILLDILKLILIFPFVIYFILLFIIKNEKQTYLLVSLLYLFSMVLLVRFLFPGIIMYIAIIAILGLLGYITLGLMAHKKVTFTTFTREFLLTTGRFYPYIYMLLFVIGVIEEFIKIR